MRILLITLVLLTGLGTTATYAGPTLFTSNTLYGYNKVDGEMSFGIPLERSVSDVTISGETASSNSGGDKVINGIDSSGEAASMTITYDGASEAHSDGTLKARVSASLTNGFYNAANDPFVIDANYNTDPDGVPEKIELDSYAAFDDILTILGDSSLDHITIDLNIDGTINSDDYGATNPLSAIIQLDTGPSILFRTETSVENETITSNSMQVTNGLVDLAFVLFAGIRFKPYDGFFDEAGTDYLFGVVDFYNTLTFGEIKGFDANGNPVDVSSATGSSGVSFDTFRVSTVPEPAPLALLGLGLLGLGLARKRRG